MRSLLACGVLLALPACTASQAVYVLSHEAPPPELGRPPWVRAAAGVGAWIGAVGGALVSVVTLPVTYPIALLAEEPLGYSRREFLFFPVTLGASAGHFLLGAPTDLIDFTFRRAWVESTYEAGYELVPVRPPGAPEPVPEPPDRTPLEAADPEGAEKPPPEQ